jgi:hypothetical protein
MNQTNDKLQHFAEDHDMRLQLAKNCFAAMRISALACESFDSPEEYLRKVIYVYFFFSNSYLLISAAILLDN